MFRWAIVSEVDADAGRVKVRFPEEADVESYWVPVLSSLAFGARVFALPRSGALVGVLDYEDGEAAAIIGGAYNNQDATPSHASASVLVVELEDGTRVSIDPEARSVKVAGAGSVSVKAASVLELEGASVTVRGPATFTDPVVMESSQEVKADQTVRGNVDCKGDMKVAGKSDARHEHPVAGGKALMV